MLRRKPKAKYRAVVGLPGGIGADGRDQFKCFYAAWEGPEDHAVLELIRLGRHGMAGGIGDSDRSS